MVANCSKNVNLKSSHRALDVLMTLSEHELKEGFQAPGWGGRERHAAGHDTLASPATLGSQARRALHGPRSCEATRITQSPPGALALLGKAACPMSIITSSLLGQFFGFGESPLELSNEICLWPSDLLFSNSNNAR